MKNNADTKFQNVQSEINTANIFEYSVTLLNKYILKWKTCSILMNLKYYHNCTVYK